MGHLMSLKGDVSTGMVVSIVVLKINFLKGGANLPGIATFSEIAFENQHNISYDRNLGEP